MYQYYQVLIWLVVWQLWAAVNEVAGKYKLDLYSESEQFFQESVDDYLRECILEIFGQKPLNQVRAPFFMFRNSLIKWKRIDFERKVRANKIRLSAATPPLIRQKLSKNNGKSFSYVWGIDESTIWTDYPGFLSYCKSEKEIADEDASDKKIELLKSKLANARQRMLGAVDSLATFGKHGPLRRDICKFWIKKLENHWKCHERNFQTVEYLKKTYPGITTSIVSFQRHRAKKKIKEILGDDPIALSLFEHYLNPRTQSVEEKELSDKQILSMADKKQTEIRPYREKSGTGILSDIEKKKLVEEQTRRFKQARELGYYGCYDPGRCPPVERCPSCARSKGIYKVVKWGYVAPDVVLGNRDIYKKKKLSPGKDIGAEKLTQSINEKPKSGHQRGLNAKVQQAITQNPKSKKRT